MADAPAAKPAAPSGMGFRNILILFGALYLFSQKGIRDAVGHYSGFVLEPVLGFGGKFPVLTIMLTGALLVIGTTLVRHFTTDWIENARIQAYSAHYRKELMKAQKEKNLYRLKQLDEYKPKMMEMSQKMQAAQMKSMPITMIVAFPLYSWLTLFLSKLDYEWFSAPWNAAVTMFGGNGIIPWFGHQSSLLPHYILLYVALSVPLGSLIQKGMKYFSWKERWQKRHPGVTE